MQSFVLQSTSQELVTLAIGRYHRIASRNKTHQKSPKCLDLYYVSLLYLFMNYLIVNYLPSQYRSLKKKNNLNMYSVREQTSEP